jgi:hypothetical protein
MAICVNCGVELDDGLLICPLCGKHPKERTLEAVPFFNYPGDISNLQRKEIRKSLWELSAIIAFSAVAVCTIVDLVIEKKLTWSLFSDATIAGMWLILTLFLHAYKKPFVIVPGLVVTVLADLFLIDLITGGRKWFFDAGLPLVISAIATVLAIIILYKIANLKGLNIIAAALVVLSGSCIIIEMILDDYVKGSVDLRWSLIVAISVFPVAALLLYYHYRLKRVNLLDRFLHI